MLLRGISGLADDTASGWRETSPDDARMQKSYVDDSWEQVQSKPMTS